MILGEKNMIEGLNCNDQEIKRINLSKNNIKKSKSYINWSKNYFIKYYKYQLILLILRCQ